MNWTCTDKGNNAFAGIISIRKEFIDQKSCHDYLNGELSDKLQNLGYLAFSVDSLKFSSEQTEAYFHLGNRYQYGVLTIDPQEHNFLTGISLPKVNQPIDPIGLMSFKKTLLSYYENNGYPFAGIKFDSGYFKDNAWYAKIKIDKGPLYHIDSIHLEGKVRLNKHYLGQLLDIPPKGLYSKAKLDRVSDIIRSTGFLEERRPWDMTMLGTGSVLNLYLDQRQADQLDLLAGFMPSSDGQSRKLMLTGEANMQLKNAFSSGEEVMVNWQQLQVRSPRLQIGLQKPFMFNTPFGIDFQFNLLKKDSSYLNVHSYVGLRYRANGKTDISIYLDQFSSMLINVDTNFIRSTKKLPSVMDVGNSHLGIAIQHETLNNKINPTKGSKTNLNISAGFRRIQKNQNIISIATDLYGRPFDFRQLYDTVKLKTIQARTMFRYDKFFPFGKQSTLKFGVNAAHMISPNNFINEMFQIGGLKTLRGINEESVFASSYLISNMEYRYLIGSASYLYAFFDGAQTVRKSYGQALKGTYFGTGLGFTFETKSGMFNLAYAIGKQPEQHWGIRDGKIHFGFVTLF